MIVAVIMVPVVLAVVVALLAIMASDSAKKNKAKAAASKRPQENTVQAKHDQLNSKQSPAQEQHEREL